MQKIELIKLNDIVLLSIEGSKIEAYTTTKKTDIEGTTYKMLKDSMVYFRITNIGDSGLFVSETYLLELLLQDEISSIENGDIYEHGYPESRLIPSNQTVYEDQCKTAIKLIEEAEKELKEKIDVFDEKVREEKRVYALESACKLAAQAGLENTYVNRINYEKKEFANVTMSKKKILEDITLQVETLLKLQTQKYNNIEYVKSQLSVSSKLAGLSTELVLDDISHLIGDYETMDIVKVSNGINATALRRKEAEELAVKQAEERIRAEEQKKAEANERAEREKILAKEREERLAKEREEKATKEKEEAEAKSVSNDFVSVNKMPIANPYLAPDRKSELLEKKNAQLAQTERVFATEYLASWVGGFDDNNNVKVNKPNNLVTLNVTCEEADVRKIIAHLHEQFGCKVEVAATVSPIITPSEPEEPKARPSRAVARRV